MKTTAIRLYGANDLRMETFELPEIGDDEALIRIVSDSLCASTYKAVKQGVKHKRVPSDIQDKPIIVGHEMCGDIIEVGRGLTNQWRAGQKIVLQPALKLENNYDLGYSYSYIGGSATYAVVLRSVLERGCMIAYNGDSYYKGSLVEPIGCVLRAFKSLYHIDYTTYKRTDGAKRGGRLAILGGAGPMGLAAAELAAGYAGVSQVVITDIDGARLNYVKRMCNPADFQKRNAELLCINTAKLKDPVQYLKEISGGGFDDVFVMAPVSDLVTQGEKILRADGCLNFFAGPAASEFTGCLNMYRVHYDGIHLLGSAGSIQEDTLDTISLIERRKINPSVMVSHILGLDAVVDAIYGMENPSGCKKVCYTHLELPLTAISDFEQLGKGNPLFARLDRIVKENGGIWCAQAEAYLLENAPKIDRSLR